MIRPVNVSHDRARLASATPCICISRPYRIRVRLGAVLDAVLFYQPRDSRRQRLRVRWSLPFSRQEAVCCCVSVSGNTPEVSIFSVFFSLLVFFWPRFPCREAQRKETYLRWRQRAFQHNADDAVFLGAGCRRKESFMLRRFRREEPTFNISPFLHELRGRNRLTWDSSFPSIFVHLKCRKSRPRPPPFCWEKERERGERKNHGEEIFRSVFSLEFIEFMSGGCLEILNVVKF